MTRLFLYLSPYFPPGSRVGALRPLKLVRHLPGAGWSPVVVADLSPSDTIDHSLTAAVPAGTTVVRTWSRRASTAAPTRPPATDGPITDGPAPDSRRVANGPAPDSRRVSDDHGRDGSFRGWLPTAGRLVERFGPGPEWLPLGRHTVDLNHARRAAARALADHGACAAIVVNADPWAALLVGRDLSVRSGLPLVVDLRDPWSVCELRRPRRPPIQRRLVDRWERSVVEQASAVVLNTDAAADAYRCHYPDVDPHRFVTIRNHADAELISVDLDGAAPPPADGPADLWFFGRFRRDVDGGPLLAVLADLTARGHEVRLRVTGQVTPEARHLAHRLGVADRLVASPHVPYRRLGAAMAGAHVLVALGHAGRQRIPAKVYDYLASDRPIVVLSDSRELARLLDPVPGAWVWGRHQVTEAADVIEGLIAGRTAAPEDDGVRIPAGRHRTGGFDAITAAARLADVLDRVTAGTPTPAARS